MPENENQPVTNYRSGLVDRFRPSYPDMDFDAQNGQNGQDALLEVVSKEFEKLDAKLGEYQQHEEQLMGLVSGSDKDAVFVNEWLRTGNRAQAFRKAYGAEAFNALNTEEGATVLAEIEAEEARREAEDQAAKEEKKANLMKSFDRLDQFGDKYGMSDQDKLDLFSSLNNLLQDAANGIYNEDFFLMAMRHKSYDSDIAKARNEGLVEGRNQRADQIIKNSGSRRQASIPMLQGQSQRAVEAPKDATPTEGSTWMVE